MKKIYSIALSVFFILVACKGNQKPSNKSTSEGNKIPEVTISADEQLYTAISRLDNNNIQTHIAKAENKAEDITRFKNKVFVRNVGGKWTAIGIADNYDIYWPRQLGDVVTVVKQAQDPSYFDARKIIIPPAYDSSGNVRSGISVSGRPEEQDKSINSNVRLSWVGRAANANYTVGETVNPVNNFNLQPGDDFGANASYEVISYKVDDKYPSSGGDVALTQTDIDNFTSKAGINPRYNSEKSPNGHPARKWAWSFSYSYNGIPQVQFRLRVAYTHKEGTVPSLTNGLETQTVFYRRYSSSGTAGENDSSAQIMSTVVSKNIWVTNVKIDSLLGSSKPTGMEDEAWNKVKDNNIEVFAAEFQENLNPDPGTSSYAAAAYDGYDSSLDRPSGTNIFINPEFIN